MIECVREYLNNIASELGKSIEDVDMESIERAAHIIMESEKQGGRIHVTGIGEPGYVAGYIASLLSSAGTSAYELRGTEAARGSSGQVKKRDMVIAISNSRETVELEATIQTPITNGVHIISCTGNPQSTLAKRSEVCLVAHVNEEGDALNKPPCASILSEILIPQCLNVVLQKAEKLDLNQYVKWRPGGSLGKSTKELQEQTGGAVEKFNIVIGTHGRFGGEPVDSARMIAGALENVQCCSLLPEYSFEDYMKLADETMCIKEGFTTVPADLYGGTPCNVFTTVSRKYHYPVLTGLNPPMLIDLYLKLSNMDEADLDEEVLLRETMGILQTSCVHTNTQLESRIKLSGQTLSYEL